ncbi:MAG: hypothetical protein A2021_04295 [Elusimicrobia bacterium GWF2_52_66]|nr:MAG: hypothetical protein A2X33_04120 [Elusimicrobia bacterium GWA2_51_34]OGR85938.1 MAG: hypothetical protein A2021_04295 [Elusimicrobia bacterium GWF2_52_66]HAF96505.1 hypothetical protein [Elusimicrobiota bacterium]HCE97584.1 hypothetical protein [Elusimicrobiota bacterium]
MPLNSDTNIKAREFLIARLRTTPPGIKLLQAAEMTNSCAAFCMAGIRSRRPGISEEDVRLEFARLHLGGTLTAKVYGGRKLL